MKVISLLQPWATLVVIGAKKIETRSWNTNFRGTVLVHASKSDKACKQIAHLEPFASALKGLDELPLGKIIGAVDIVGTAPTSFILLTRDAGIPLRQPDGKDRPIQPNWEAEIAFGDYGPGQRAWLLDNPVHFKTAIPCRGSLSLWDSPIRICEACGCHDADCRHCIEETGRPCFWVEENLCSACLK
jgi:hypothetical protein